MLSQTTLEKHLKKWFGYNHFRAHQVEIIQTVLQGSDVLAILPTGAGKSLCYQLPALISDGVAIVISPLIALMQDQVVSLFKNGISAAFINSSLNAYEIQEVLDHLQDYKLIYVAPERLVDSQFLNRLKEISISFFVIDEAHCISQWGHSFRGEYRKLSILKENFPLCPIMALTATATPDVEKDIQTQLAMRQPAIIKGSFDRPNLSIRVENKQQVERQLNKFLLKQTNQSGIIYAATRKGVETTYASLKAQGFVVERYHAGMSEVERSASQHAFIYDEVPLMVATVAFGMGIHKPDIRFIIHLDMPRTVEQYYQEIGRAGRDGLPAECLMLYSAQDVFIYKRFLEELEDPFIRKQMEVKTNRMTSFCLSQSCRRNELLRYFGEKSQEKFCKSCDNCVDDVEQMEGTIIAQKILSCVYRLQQNFGIKMVVDVLRGSKNQAIQQRQFDQLSTYGILSDISEQELRYYIDSLIFQGFLILKGEEYPLLKWTDKTLQAMKEKHAFYFKKRLFKKSKTKEPIRTNALIKSDYDEKLFEALKNLRQEKAQEEKVPAFVVFSDRALQEMALYYPQNPEEFIKINGVGPIKAIKYGAAFLSIVQSFEKEKSSFKTLDQKVTSKQETVELFLKGMTIAEIMQNRNLTHQTIILHLANSIEEGISINIDSLVHPSRQEHILNIIQQIGSERLNPIKERLPSDFNFDEIRLVLALYNASNAMAKV